MKVDTGVGSVLSAAATQAAESEHAGYFGIWGTETGHDPFLPLLLAASGTKEIELGTSIAVAFARSPMTVAATAWDLQSYSGGRFNLGLGSQIKAHIERRYSMPWSHPAPRMREFISALRAIWKCWAEDGPLDFRGDFYSHTLMTPFFNPGPLEPGIAAPKVFLAAVGEKMTMVAAEVADGMLVHGFSTERYLREVTLPAIAQGLATSGRPRSEFQIAYPVFIVTGANDAAIATASIAVRGQIAFYGSTPAYRPVLELHGWGELQPELNALSKKGAWAEMAGLITDDVLDAFAVVGQPDTIAARLSSRFGDVVDRVSFYLPYELDARIVRQILGDLVVSATTG